MTNRANDWLRQADRDLEQAEDSRGAGRHEWACFAAHQAAEKAVKALHLSCGQEAWGPGQGARQLLRAGTLSQRPHRRRPLRALRALAERGGDRACP
jgi:HEPN domain-containing protein